MSTSPTSRTRRSAGTPTGGQFAPEAHAEPEVALDPGANPPAQPSESRREVDADGSVRWCDAEGRLHRDGGPAFEQPGGTRAWLQHGQIHRDGGPAIEYPDGSAEWFQHGRRHRDDGPATETPTGYRVWLQHGERHRADGPAVEYTDGTREWWFEGGRYQPDEHGRPNVCDEAALCSDHGIPLADGCWKCVPEDYCVDCHAPIDGAPDGRCGDCRER